MIVMNLQPRAWWLGTILISTLLPAGLRAASLQEVKSVYLFPMQYGLDQYLADRLTHDHVLQVVTDPKAADAVITDRLGDAFQEELLRVRPELKPPPPKPPSKDKDKTADKDKDKDKDADKADKADKKDEEEDIRPPSSFHSARGTVFLVHAKTQQVVWSAYQLPGSHDPKTMERTATRLAKLLEKDLAPPPVAASPARK